MTPRLEVRGISKSFGGIVALRDVSFAVAPGTVHALLGENGAGKSTLVKLVTGIHAADTGTALLDGSAVAFASPTTAREAGVVAVYQDPKLFPHLDVAENIFIGKYPMRAGLIDRRAMYDTAGKLLGRLGVRLDARQAVMGLSIGEAQFVEFARAMAVGDMRILFMDEPTAALSPGETQRLFDFVLRQKALGVAVVFISHRLEELRGLVDAVTILRDGQHVLTEPADLISDAGIVRAMVGRDVSLARRSGAGVAFGPVLLQTTDFAAPGMFAGVSFDLRAGEIVGMAGLVGAGRTEVALGIMGLLPKVSGRVTVGGTDMTGCSPKVMREAGVAYVPEDRDRTGLIPSHSIRQNLTMAVLGRLSRRGFVSMRRDRARADELINALQIKAGGMEDAVSTLSGGNRQKVVIGKWLATGPKIFILDEPTHGIDVGTKAHVHDLIRDLAAKGAAILVISSDLPEVLALSDRIVVMRNGRIAGTLNGESATDVTLMALASSGERAA